LHTFKTKPGSATKPAPGYEIEIMDENNQVVKEASKIGKLCIKLPMPPSFMTTLHNNPQGFVQKYLVDPPGYYNTGDAAYVDAEGYVHVVTRTDDVIKTAGHRLSTSQMEEVLMHHPDVSEAAVVGGVDNLKGEIPIGFVVLHSGKKRDGKEIEKELIKKVREEIGPVAVFKCCLVVDKLPKTRSGKILRGMLKQMVDGEEYKVNPTIEDESVVPGIAQKVREAGLGKKTTLVFEESEVKEKVKV